MGEYHFTDVMLHSSISYHQQHALPAVTYHASYIRLTTALVEM